MESSVKKAIILAAGLGTRLRPFTGKVPKPLMKVGGETMLGRIVKTLRQAGVEEITMNCHHLFGQIAEWCAENGCAVSYEKEILGTGGALNPIRKWIKDEDFYLVNGDIVFGGVDFAALDEAAKDEKCIAAAVVTHKGPRTIEVTAGNVSNWQSPNRGCEENFTYAGIALIKAKILDFVEREGFSTIIEAYKKAENAGYKVSAVEMPALEWNDAGTIRSYLDVNRGCLEKVGIEFLGSRGSERSFYRAGDGLIILYEDARRGENAKYVGHARFLLEHGINVPRVLADYPESKVSVFEFAGEEAMMNVRDYERVVDELVKFNAIGEAAAELPLEEMFGPRLWQWEVGLFEKYCLEANFKVELTDAVKAEYSKIERVLEGEPKALVHRDFQSTNILWKDGKPVFIDFQGMRLGPAAYDLASLVYDPYVRFPEKARRRLIAYYAQRSGRSEIVKTVPYAAVQRLTQCLGAYGRLATVGQPQFWKNVPAALDNLSGAAREAGLEAIAELSERLTAFTTKLHLT